MFRAVDEAELRRVIRSFNLKVKKVKKANPTFASFQPDKVDVESLVDRVKKGTRAGYKEILRHYQAYLEEGAEEVVRTDAGVVTTQYQVSEMSRQVKNINAFKTANRKKAEKYASPYKGTMGRTRDVETKNIKNRTQSIGVREFEAYARSLEERLLRFKNREYDDIYKENYLKAIKAVYGENSRLYQMVSNISPVDLANLYYKDVALSINFSYPAIGTTGSTDDEDYIIHKFAEYGYEVPDLPDDFTI